jgi:hypothetical protein
MSSLSDFCGEAIRSKSVKHALNEAIKKAVFKGELSQTAGGLTKDDLAKNSRGQIVSLKRHLAGKKVYDAQSKVRDALRAGASKRRRAPSAGGRKKRHAHHYASADYY